MSIKQRNNTATSKFKSNLGYAFLAQGVALALSASVNFILPKFIGVTDFSYWQLFIFYSQYLPFLALGLNDGVYLRYGGIALPQMDKAAIKGQFLYGIVYQTILAVLLCIVSWFVIGNGVRLSIIITASLYFVFFTMQNFLGYIFQAANETSWFSKSTLIQQLAFIFMIIVCITCKGRTFWPYVIAYTIAQALSLAYCFHKGKNLFSAHALKHRLVFRELRESISAGSKLMFANIASMLILGIGRQAIDMNWGIVAFGKVSMAITLTNFALVFVRQVGMVMFPMLRQVHKDKQKSIYALCNDGLFLFLPVMFLLYFPAKIILELWLPQYTDSIRYAALLLPICYFDAKTQMLYNTYLKVFRKEKMLLYLNLLAMVASLIFSIIGVLVIKNMTFIILSMTAAIVIRSVTSDAYLSSLLCNDRKKDAIMLTQEIALTLIFMTVAWHINEWIAFIVTCIAYTLLLLFNHNKLTLIIRHIWEK
ncbi:hypothetical protein [Bifidobacterium olomucense]|uniref:Polysaccharide transporter n=1 Tax=Bifidobacterium olomucense TaxID=2675324 RepID=A0A7Y0F151_9BIFI|nr:hypothetical protein [Bifidobacterium sp. DSM 109959]NMM99131.1 polysaccharide transporter [Bifidobacterium sp. DSM 109959]